LCLLFYKVNDFLEDMLRLIEEIILLTPEEEYNQKRICFYLQEDYVLVRKYVTIIINICKKNPKIHKIFVMIKNIIGMLARGLGLMLRYFPYTILFITFMYELQINKFHYIYYISLICFIIIRMFDFIADVASVGGLFSVEIFL